MGLLFIDSFDDRTAPMDGIDNPFKYTASGTVTGAYFTIISGGRTGNRLKMEYSNGSAWLRKALPSALATFYVGGSLQADGNASACNFMWFEDGATVHLRLQLSATRQLSVYRGDGTLLSGPSVDTVATAAYIEFSGTIHDTTGAFTLKMNGVAILSGTNVDTRNGGNASIDGVRIGNDWLPNVYLDDFYIADDQFYGGLKIVTLLPNGNGNTNAWVGSDGNSTDNYLLTDEGNPNDGTDYVKAFTVGDKDLYAFANLPDNSVTVKAVQLWTRHTRDDAVTRKFKPVIRSGGTDYQQAEVTTTQTTYKDDVKILLVDPATSAAWTGANVDAVQAGVEVTV